MKRFATNTRVPIERSRAEIERVITRYGATRLATMYLDERALISFEIKDRRVRFELPTPDRQKFKRPDSYDKEHRRLWRAFALVIKAQLEAVASGVFTFDDMFLAHIVDPRTNKTFGETTDQRMLAVSAHPLLKAAAS